MPRVRGGQIGFSDKRGRRTAEFAEKETFMVTPVTINFNLVNQGSAGYDVPDNDYTVTVFAGYAVGSDTVGFITTKLNTILDNHGYIFGMGTGSNAGVA